MFEHEYAARAWRDRTNGFNVRGNRLIVVETIDREGVTTIDPNTGDAVVWRVPYAANKRDGFYRRLAPKRAYEVRLAGSWREMREAASGFRI